MKHIVPKGGLVVRGPSYVTAHKDKVERVYQQGQYIPAGYVVTDCQASAKDTKAMGLKTDETKPRDAQKTTRIP